MLIDKYLSAYDFNECHFIKVNASANDAYERMLNCDMSRSLLIKFLFSLRGIPKHLYTINHLSSIGFIKLEEQRGKEIVFGMITTSPTFNSCLSTISPASFIQNTNPTLIKAVINFSLKDENNSTQIITTETRIWCGSCELRKKFKYYWFFIKPFSQLVRRTMLKQMKKQIMNANNI